MDDYGFVYVLVNPSMPGLVKVGKTTNDPEERARELSDATGVPTPFIVCYQRPVNSCSEAELYAHTILENKGFRVNDSREFFKCSPTEAINVILSYNDTSSVNFENIAGNDAAVEMTESPYVVEELLTVDYYYGLGDVLQDYREAMKHGKKAVALGSVMACRYVGMMYEDGKGVKSSITKALQFYQKGADGNEVGCLENMLGIFFKEGNAGNALKCWERIKNIVGNETQLIGSHTIFTYLTKCLENNIPAEMVDSEYLQSRIKDVEKEFSDMEEQATDPDSKRVMHILHMRLKFSMDRYGLSLS